VKQSKKVSALVLAVLAAMLIAGCGKKKPVAQAPPSTPPPPAPTASLSANPDAIAQGQSTTLTWQTENATDVTIDALGAVSPSGSRSVSPVQSTTYRLTAKGPGGTQEATARVTVSAQAEQGPSLSDAELFAQNVKDIYFDYDAYTIRADQQGQIQQGAAFLKQHPNWKFTIEGHCDERGSIEYNLSLGTNRAEAVKNALVQAGVNGSNIRTVTFGKEKPFCTEANESCWQQNRRGHFVLTK